MLNLFLKIKKVVKKFMKVLLKVKMIYQIDANEIYGTFQRRKKVNIIQLLMISKKLN